MRVSKLFILLNFLFAFSVAQTNTKASDKYVEQINTYLKDNSLKKKSLDHMSTVGGAVAGYYLNKKLVLITTNYGGAFSDIGFSFYILNDSIVFVNESKVVLKEPITEKEYSEYERYVIFHTDKQGNTDLTKWPLSTDIHNDYYFKNGTIVKYELRNFKKKFNPAGDHIAETTLDLLSRFKTHVEELTR